MFAGLSNPGAIGFVNTLIQVLHHIPGFRRRIFSAPTSEIQDKGRSILFQLQKLFYTLQTTTNNTTNVFGLTTAFGWSQNELKYQQQDISEFFNVILEALDTEAARLKAPQAPGALFDTHLMNYIKCINVDYEKSRNELFSLIAAGLSVPVAGCATLEDSIRRFMESEVLDGDNQYSTDDFGKQDAIKGIALAGSPAVLAIQLRRYEYDFFNGGMTKLFDRVAYPTTLDVSSFIKPALPAGSETFELYSVITHLGLDASGGSYACFIRPNLSNDGSDAWFYFSDATVRSATAEEATERSCGGGAKTAPVAYMLIYVKKEHQDMMFKRVEEDEVAEHIKAT